jgi:hypothetical protein
MRDSTYRLKYLGFYKFLREWHERIFEVVWVTYFHLLVTKIFPHQVLGFSRSFVKKFFVFNKLSTPKLATLSDSLIKENLQNSEWEFLNWPSAI